MTVDWTPDDWGKPVAMDIDQALEEFDALQRHGCCPSEDYNKQLQKAYRNIVVALKSRQMNVAFGDNGDPVTRFALDDVALRAKLKREGFTIRKCVVVMP